MFVRTYGIGDFSPESFGLKFSLVLTRHKVSLETSPSNIIIYFPKNFFHLREKKKKTSKNFTGKKVHFMRFEKDLRIEAFAYNPLFGILLSGERLNLYLGLKKFSTEKKLKLVL